MLWMVAKSSTSWKTILLVVDRISSTHRTPGLVSSLFSGLNQLISRALFDGVWIGKDDLEVLRAAGGIHPGYNWDSEPLATCKLT